MLTMAQSTTAPKTKPNNVISTFSRVFPYAIENTMQHVDSIASTPENPPPVPLILDIDGTLLRTDLLFETFWAALAHDVFATLRVLFICWRMPPMLKKRLRAIAEPDIALVPVRASVLELAQAAMAAGRPVHLASGADQGLVDAVARRFDLSGTHFGTNEARNLTRKTKARFLVSQFGERGYDYAGNSWADQAAWQHARNIIAVSPTPRLSKWLYTLGKPLAVLQEHWTVSALLQQITSAQWALNALVFLPLLIAPNLSALVPVLITFIVFCFGASALSTISDLLALGDDRRHLQRQHRPIASGALPIQTAMAAAVLLAVAAFGLAIVAGPAIGALMAIYLLGSLAHALWLKARKWAILPGAALLLLRVIAGSTASSINLSGGVWSVLAGGLLVMAWGKHKTGLRAL